MENFKHIQHQFMAHIRDPENNQIPSHYEDRRMGIYRDLFFNNIESFVASAFPVLKSLYTEQTWKELVRDFFINHDCQSPYFLDISESFLDYLIEQRELDDSDPVFMIELAHYEWIELALSIKKETREESQLMNGQLKTTGLYLSELATVLSYSFPVHQISADFQPQEGVEGSCHLIVYRDSEDEVGFMAINALTALMMQVLEEKPGLLFEEIIALVGEQVPQFTSEQLKQGAEQILSLLIDKKILITLNS